MKMMIIFSILIRVGLTDPHLRLLKPPYVVQHTSLLGEGPEAEDLLQDPGGGLREGRIGSIDMHPQRSRPRNPRGTNSDPRRLRSTIRKYQPSTATRVPGPVAAGVRRTLSEPRTALWTNSLIINCAITI